MQFIEKLTAVSVPEPLPPRLWKASSSTGIWDHQTDQLPMYSDNPVEDIG